MAGAVDVETRGAIEAGERDGGQPQADSAGVQGRGMGPCSSSQGEGGGRGGAAAGIPTALLS